MIIKQEEKDLDLVKLRFLKDGKPTGREYTYSSKSRVEVGDTVIVREPDAPGEDAPKGVITEVGVPESEAEKFKDRLKEIVGRIEKPCEVKKEVANYE